MGVESAASTRVFQFADFLTIEPETHTSREFTGMPLGANGHRVYNFEVEKYHTYIADGVRVHNTSVLSFLEPHELINVDFSSLEDTNNDGSFDYVEVDRIINGKQAGTTVYKQEGTGTVRGFQTYTDENGRLVQLQFTRDASGTIQKNTIELTGAEFGENVGRVVTPFITAAIFGDDASAFERFASDTIIGTFVQNAFELAGGYIHDQIVSQGLQNNSFDAIAENTFGDFGIDLAANAVDGAQNLLTEWILGEVFEGLNTDNFEGKLAYVLASQGVDFILDATIHEIATDVLNLSPTAVSSYGLAAPNLNQIFSGANVLNLVFSAAVGTVLPSLESTEAQIGSSLITLALNFFAGVGGIWGSVIGYIGGVVLDLFFDKDPEAYASVVYSDFTGELRLDRTVVDDGGNRALANSMAHAYIDFVNELIDRTSAKSHNLAQLAQTMNLVFGHDEEIFKNGDGGDYADAQQAVVARAADTIKLLTLNDGDVKFAAAIAYIASNSSGLNAQQVLNEFSLRAQIAADYQSYLENKELYDELIAADPESAFAAGWATTFALAAQFGYTEDFNVTGDATDSVHITSSGNDFVNAEAGNDVVRTYAGDDTLHGGDGNDTLYGGSGNDSLSGEDGNDILYGGGGDNTLIGGLGVDEFFIGQGNNAVYGGGNEDLITFEGNFSEFTVEDLGNNQVVVTQIETGSVTELFDVEFLKFKDTVRTYDPSYDNFITGTPGDDLLNGTELRDAINGFTGDDTIYGFDADDFISGDAGDDQLFGGRGNDWIFGVLGNDLIVSGEGNDFADGGANGDYLWGDEGNDTLQGQGGDDVLNGGTGNDSVFGGTGDDVVEGAEGADLVRGGNGDDNLFGGVGNDTLDGGYGDDEIHGGDAQDEVRAGHGDDVIYAGSGHDTIYASNGDDIVHAGDGNDQIFGSWGDDIVYGGDGNDKIFTLLSAYASSPFSFNTNTPGGTGAAYHYGEWGRDVAYGGAGNDQISLNGEGSVAFGGSGNDVIYAGFSQQRIDGGTGFDKVVTQVFNFKDVVWYKSASGTVGAVLHDTHAGGSGHSLRPITSGELEYSLFVNVERVQARNGNYLDQGYSYSNGYGNARYNSPSYSGFINLSDEDFEDLFSEEAFLDRRWVSVHSITEPDGNGGVTQLLTVNPDWDTFGNANNVILEGNSAYSLLGDQRINAGGGNDNIEVGAGSDHVRGDGGNDTLRGESGADTLEGGDGNDSLSGGSGNDALLGEIGHDLIEAGSGDDSVLGGAGADSIFGNSGHDTLNGEDNDDRLFGGSGRDLIYGGSGNDFIQGDAAPDTLNGGDGNDTINGNDGGDYILGGAGNDELVGQLGIDLIKGGSGNDYILGDEGSDKLYGEIGNDTIYAGSAADNLSGGSGHDHLFGGDGNDDLKGEEGNDTLNGGAGADRLDGGAGIDFVAYRTAAEIGVTASLLLGRGIEGEAAGDVYINIENLDGSIFDDNLTGDTGNNEVFGRAGNDLISGQAGDDYVDGGSGDDILHGDDGNDLIKGVDGNDQLFGGEGHDTLRGWDGDDTLEGGAGDDDLEGALGNDDLHGGAGNDTLNGNEGNDLINGGAGNDSLSGQDGEDLLSGGAGNDTISGGKGSDNLDGGQGDDSLNGDAGNDVLSGGFGEDTINGGDGDDVLVGGDENDRLYGGAGNDILLDGEGNDRLYGQSGADRFVLSLGSGTGDRIADFTDGEDLIDVSAWGVVSFSNLTLWGNNTKTYIRDDNGNAVRLDGLDFTTSTSVLTATDFVFSTDGGGDTTAPTGNVVTGTEAADVIDAAFGTSDGADIVDGLGGDDKVYGGGGNDELVDGAGKDTLYGEAGEDVLTSSDDGSRDYLYGGAGNDVVTIGGNDDRGYGGDGDDTLIQGEGNGRLSGDAGADIFVLLAGSGTGDRIMDYTDGEDLIDISAWGVSSFDELTIWGNTKSYVRDDNGNAVRLQGLAIDDALAQLTEDDFIFVSGGGGSPEPTNEAPSAANDTATLTEGGTVLIDVLANDSDPDGDALSISSVGTPASGTATIEAGQLRYTPNAGFSGSDSVSYVVADGNGGTSTASLSITVEAAPPPPIGNVVTGTEAADVIDAAFGIGDGVDIVDGLGGDDKIYGGGGNDKLVDGAGKDSLYGDAGDDVLTGVEDADRDYFYGGAGNDVITTGGSDDRAYGNDGNDTLMLGSGDGRLYGGNGDDTLVLGSGKGRLSGEAGADTFVLIAGSSSSDRIGDFTDGEDLIDISAWGVSSFDELTIWGGTHSYVRDDNGNAIRLNALAIDDALAQLSEDDFIFV